MRVSVLAVRKNAVVLEAPSNLGLKPPRPGVEPGVRRLPEALAAAGLPQSLAAQWGGRIAPGPYSAAIDPATNIRNAPAIARFSTDLARAVGAVLDRGGFPLVLGGDCSILLGSLLALRRRGRSGLFFLDGHGDFASPETSPSQAAAGMDLALATGRGPRELSDLDGLGPLARDEDVVVMGFRDGDVLPKEIAGYDVESLRAEGIEETARRELDRLRGNGVDSFWIHVDADVLDPSVMPAVDSPEPGGLAAAELTALLRGLLSSGLAAGMQVCIYDPDLDPDGSCARSLSQILAEALGENCSR